MKKNRKKIGYLILLLSGVLLLSGCRPSPALQQIIYTKDAAKVDEEQHQLEQNDKGEEDERFSKDIKDDAETKRDTTQTAAASDPKTDNDGTAKDTEKGKGDAKADAKEEASEDADGDDLEELGDADAEGTQGESSDDGTETDTGDETDPGDNGSDTGKKDETGSSPDVQEAEEAKKKVVTDGNGEEQEIPEDVKTVTAVGPAAAMVEMVGGSGRLIGSSESVTENALSKKVFSDVSEGAVKTWWEDTGKTAISDGSVDGSAFKELLEAKPQVCFEISGQNTFSKDQVEALEDAGIGYLVLPELSSVSNLKKAVTIVAKALDENDTTGKSAEKIASEYSDWVDSTIQDVENKTNNVAMYSVYIAEWKNDVSYTLYHTNDALPVGSSGSGVAVAWTVKKAEMVSVFMNAAGVSNEATAIKSLTNQEGVYVTPMFHQFTPEFSEDETASYYASSNIAISADWFVTHQSNDVYSRLGSDAYPAIIVASSEIKNKIKNDWFWKYHGVFKDENVTWMAGYQNPDTGDLFYSSIIGDYDILVNPTGLDDWAEGSVESPLEAYWVANKIAGKYSDSVLSSKVSSFYSKFFDADLSDSQIQDMINK